MKTLKTLTSLIVALLIAVMPAASDAVSVAGACTPAVIERYEGVRNARDIKLVAGNCVKFGRKTAYGFVSRHSEGYCEETGTVMPIEADYGLTLTSEGMIIYVNGYDHTGKNITVRSAEIVGVSDGNNKLKIKMNSRTPIDTSKFKTGLYHISATFSNNKQLDIYFYVNIDAASPCTVEKESFDAVLERRVALSKAVEKAEKSTVNGGFAMDGSKSIDLKNFYYPNAEWGRPDLYRCDTKRWAGLSDTLVNKNWSDEHKAYVLLMWLREHVAYDYYKTKVLHKSRMSANKDYSGKQSVWELRTGVCWDFTNIYAIMCRAQGIACASIGSESENHVWNIVRINDRWIEVDVSAYAKYGTYNEAANVRTLNKYGIWDENYDLGRYAFTIYPNSAKTMPKDVVINDSLQYGDPDDPKDDVHYIAA